jgi:hypothetical protein
MFFVPSAQIYHAEAATESRSRGLAPGLVQPEFVSTGRFVGYADFCRLCPETVFGRSLPTSQGHFNSTNNGRFCWQGPGIHLQNNGILPINPTLWQQITLQLVFHLFYSNRERAISPALSRQFFLGRGTSQYGGDGLPAVSSPGDFGFESMILS